MSGGGGAAAVVAGPAFGEAAHLIALLREAAASRRRARQVHGQAILRGLAAVPRLYAALVGAYANGGAADDEGLMLLAAAVAPPSATARLVAYTTLVSHFSRRRRQPLKALALFSDLRRWGLRPNQFTFSAVFPACAAVGAVAAGEQVHSLAVKQGLHLDLFTGSAAVDMYAKCGAVDLAGKLFGEIPHRSAVTWNALLVGLVHNQRHAQAQGFFRKMMAEGSVVPDEVSFSSALCACAAAGGDAAYGRQVHAVVIKLGADSAAYVSNALVDMYGKCGSLAEAEGVFGGATTRDAVAWNALSMAWLRRACFEEAGGCFRAMAREGGVSPDEASLSTALHAAAALAAPPLGASLHGQALRRGLAGDPSVGGCLITMYARCGDLDAAAGAFGDAAEEGRRSAVAWTSMIDACRQHGRARRAVALFEEMLAEDLQPDYVTFVCVLSACSHGGLVDEGLELFHRMSQAHAIAPGQEHYSCMVDLLGRAGRLAEARAVVEEMPIEPDASVWGALLGAYRCYGELEMAEEVAQRLFEIEPENPGNYVILSGMYRRRGMAEAAEEVRRMMGLRGVRKETSCSWIDFGGSTHVFKVRDRSHPRREEIYRMLALLRDLVGKRRKEGEEDDEDDGDGEDDENNLWGHSERIALAFGLVSLPEEAPMRIKKNLRTCGDCHEVFKSASEIFRRVIVLRDTNRFHHFAAGFCSCGDYW